MFVWCHAMCLSYINVQSRGYISFGTKIHCTERCKTINNLRSHFSINIIFHSSISLSLSLFRFHFKIFYLLSFSITLTMYVCVMCVYVFFGSVLLNILILNEIFVKMHLLTVYLFCVPYVSKIQERERARATENCNENIQNSTRLRQRQQ